MASPWQELVVATRNQHKVEELTRMLQGTGVVLRSLDEAAPEAPAELEEQGDTFVDNALDKARQVVALTGLPALADDSGLEVDALDGAPGVRSARFAGVHGDSAANTALLLKQLQNVSEPDRTARFRCVIALVAPAGTAGDGEVSHTFEGSCEGAIALAPRGSGGFGYDPVFLLPPRGVTVAELEAADKDQISHRGAAVRALREFLVR
jgi:XTP/dITP diphosphohydrolase